MTDTELRGKLKELVMTEGMEKVLITLSEIAYSQRNYHSHDTTEDNAWKGTASDLADIPLRYGPFPEYWH